MRFFFFTTKNVGIFEAHTNYAHIGITMRYINTRLSKRIVLWLPILNERLYIFLNFDIIYTRYDNIH